MERFLLAAAVVGLASIVALIVQRHRPQAATEPRWHVPERVDRSDFEAPETPWLVAVFSSATCDSCADTVAKARVLAANEVVVTEVEIGARADLHKRYAIDAVPIVVVADRQGAVKASFVGPPSATDLWEAVARVRSESA